MALLQIASDGLFLSPAGQHTVETHGRSAQGPLITGLPMASLSGHLNYDLRLGCKCPDQTGSRRT